MNDITALTSEIKSRASFGASTAKENRLVDRFQKDTFSDTLNKTIIEKEADGSKPVDKKLMDVCIEMESLFVAKMLKEMRKTVHKNGLINGGFAEEVFEDMLYDRYALDMSKKSNLGLARQLYEEMSKK